MSLDRFFDLFGVHLLAAGVNALAASAEQGDRTVGANFGPVTRYRVANSIDDLEGRRGLLFVLVVPDRSSAAKSDPAAFT